MSRARAMPEGQSREVNTSKTRSIYTPFPLSSRPGTIAAELASSPRTRASIAMSHKMSIHSFGCTKAPCTQSVTEMPHSVMSPPARVRRMVVDGPTADIFPTDGGYILDISKPTPAPGIRSITCTVYFITCTRDWYCTVA